MGQTSIDSHYGSTSYKLKLLELKLGSNSLVVYRVGIKYYLSNLIGTAEPDGLNLSIMP